MTANRALLYLALANIESRFTMKRTKDGSTHLRDCRAASIRRNVVQLTRQSPRDVCTIRGHDNESWRLPMPSHRTTTLAVCAQCGETYQTFPSRIRAGRKFCKRTCANAAKANRARPLEVRFWEKVQKGDGPDACWLWTGAPDRDGYGTISDGRNANGSHRMLRAARVALEMQLGRPLGFGMKSCHRCDNPPCIRNDGENSHLFEGTELDNKRDMLAKGRGRWGRNRGAPVGASL